MMHLFYIYIVGGKAFQKFIIGLYSGKWTVCFVISSNDWFLINFERLAAGAPFTDSINVGDLVHICILNAELRWLRSFSKREIGF